MAKKGIENLNFKSESMLNFIIQTHRKNTIYSKPHLFVLNKGLNSGKPQKTEYMPNLIYLYLTKEQTAESHKKSRLQIVLLSFLI